MRTGEARLTPGLASLLLAASDAVTGHLADIAAHGEEQDRDNGDLLVRLRAAARGATETEPFPAPPSAATAAPVAADEGARTLRVGTAALDALLQLVAELVTVRNALSRLAAAREDVALARCAGELEQVSAGLRDAVRAARTQPVGTVWQAVPRVARDTALRTGRQVRVVLSGAELECDRDVLDAVREPLLHLVRNAVDHGIEDPVARVRAGKPAEGTVRLSACREGAYVRIELSDDGAGIDSEAVAARALALGVVSADELARMSPDEVVRLVLRAGLSTADEVTTVSGRGVGMDVVNLAVQQVGGRLDLVSVPGAGTTVTVHLPVSLGIAQVLTVEAGGGRHALAVDQVVHLVQVDKAECAQLLGRTAEGAALRWRRRTVPVVELPGTAAAADGSAAFAVIRTAGGVVAVRAEAFGDTEEVVVRPLDRALDAVVPCSGSAVLGDGSVVLLLDGSALARTFGRAPATWEDADDGVDGVDGDGDERLPRRTRHRGVRADGRRRRRTPAGHRARRRGPGRRGRSRRTAPGRVLGRRRPRRNARPGGASLCAAGAARDGGYGPVGRWSAAGRPGAHPGRGEVGIAVAGVEDLAPATSAADLAEEGLRGVVLVAGRPAGQLDVRRAVADALDSPMPAEIAS